MHTAYRLFCPQRQSKGFTGSYAGTDNGGEPMLQETERLILRELTPEDFDALYTVVVYGIDRTLWQGR